jgi:hypothetical protein
VVLRTHAQHNKAAGIAPVAFVVVLAHIALLGWLEGALPGIGARPSRSMTARFVTALPPAHTQAETVLTVAAAPQAQARQQEHAQDAPAVAKRQLPPPPPQPPLVQPTEPPPVAAWQQQPAPPVTARRAPLEPADLPSSGADADDAEGAAGRAQPPRLLAARQAGAAMDAESDDPNAAASAARGDGTAAAAAVAAVPIPLISAISAPAVSMRTLVVVRSGNQNQGYDGHWDMTLRADGTYRSELGWRASAAGGLLAETALLASEGRVAGLFVPMRYSDSRAGVSLPVEPGWTDPVSVVWLLRDLVRTTPNLKTLETGYAWQTPVQTEDAQQVWTWTLETPDLLLLNGRGMQTVRISSKPAVARISKMVVWFAPDWDFLPVRLSITQADGTQLDVSWQETLS